LGVEGQVGLGVEGHVGLGVEGHVGLGVEGHVGLGVEDDKDDHLKIISFCGVGLRRGFLIKTKNAC
jgi:hypothetical protein